MVMHYALSQVVGQELLVTVRDATNGLPVAGATVTVESLPAQSGVTGPDGTFTVDGLGEGSYVVDVSAPLYRDWSGFATVISGVGQNPLDVVLAPQPHPEPIGVFFAAAGLVGIVALLAQANDQR